MRNAQQPNFMYGTHEKYKKNDVTWTRIMSTGILEANSHCKLRGSVLKYIGMRSVGNHF